MYFNHFWNEILIKSAWFPEEKLATMTAGEVVRKRKKRNPHPNSELRHRALQRIIFLADVDAVKNKTFAELADEFVNINPVSVEED